MKSSTPTSPKPPSPLKILLMGQAGSRKTWLGLQFPDVHVLDCDRNLDGPVQGLREGFKDASGKIITAPLLPNLSFTWDDIRVDDKGNMLDISECFDRVLDKLSLFRTDEAYKARKTVFVDSLSHVNEFAIRKVLKLKAKQSMEMNLWTDFASAAYTLIVAKLEQTNKTILCSCHEERVTEADDKNLMKKVITEINPLFSGRVGDNLGAYFTDVWKLEKRLMSGQVQLWLQTDRTPKCEHLKNSVGMPKELNITEGFKVIEPYLKGRI